VADIARSTVFNHRPDALCVSGLIAGDAASSDALKQAKAAVPQTPVFANTGVRLENVEAQLAVADGAVVGTTFKRTATSGTRSMEAGERLHAEGEIAAGRPVSPQAEGRWQALGDLLVDYSLG